jgi:para-nitrobenzyl esterase
MQEIVVETIYGRILGTSQDRVCSFKGIPYGGPTGGVNRFMPPTPPKPWSGIKEATSYGPASWQVIDPFTKHDMDLSGPMGINSISEDCLVLNVWTPAVNDGVKRPVMVYLHGGGLFTGSAVHSPSTNGANLAKTQDVVVVSMNHRLGVFGYLYLGELGGEKYADSANAGLLDLVAGLQWVKDNIVNFGGDPDNVTLFGQSGGAQKIYLLMAMPAAKGLFHRAIAQSGICIKAQATDQATSAASAFFKTLGISRKDTHLLHEMCADMIYTAWMTMPSVPWTPTGKTQFFPVVDGKSLPVHPFYPEAATTASDVSLIIGTNKDEMTSMLRRDPQFGKYDAATMRSGIMGWLKSFSIEISPDQLEDLITVYRHTRPGATPHDLLMAINSDMMRIASIRIAERKISGGSAPVHMYLFTWETSAEHGMLKSCHGLELPFVFNNVEPPPGIIGDAPERLTLSKRLGGIWTAFARNGNPGYEGIPLWPTYTKEKRETMIFNKEFWIENDPCSEERRAWDGII